MVHHCGEQPWCKCHTAWHIIKPTCNKATGPKHFGRSSPSPSSFQAFFLINSLLCKLCLNIIAWTSIEVGHHRVRMKFGVYFFLLLFSFFFFFSFPFFFQSSVFPGSCGLKSHPWCNFIAVHFSCGLIKSGSRQSCVLATMGGGGRNPEI